MMLRTALSAISIIFWLSAAEPSERQVAEWIIRQGGSLALGHRPIDVRHADKDRCGARRERH